MRLRNKPGAMDRIKQFPNLVIDKPEALKGLWKKQFNNYNPINIEIGTGRGDFIVGMAKLHPQVNFIGIEKYTSVIIDAMEKVIEEGLTNIVFLNKDADKLTEYFEKNEVGRVYLNFSDPWPKSRHHKRRLTHKNFLDKYKLIMPDNGEVHFKTDNVNLFEFSLQSLSEENFILQNISLDLHNSGIKNNVMTEYERKFSEKGQKIMRLEAKLK
ncbi:MAG: trmB [Bacillales bacterium]|jgi:tRNA (guanine-N7-)-methyltransferase|nr:trmB [Bacillales bacterium]